MAEQRTEQTTAQDVLRRYLATSTEASGVPLTVTDRATLLDVARWLAEVQRE